MARRIRTTLQQYLTMVVTEEWPLQQQGSISLPAWQTIETLHDQLLAFNPSTPREHIVHEIVLKHVDDLINARRTRQHMMDSSLNSVVWIVLVTLMVLTIVSCYFVGSHGIRAQMMLTGFVGAAIGAMLSLIIAMDYPFRGAVSIDSVPFQRVLDDLTRGDARRGPS